MADEQVVYETREAVAWIWLARPGQRNAQSRRLLDELDAAFLRATADEAVRVIVLAGQGDHFSAGHDLKEAQQSRANFTVEERYAYEELRYYDYCLRIMDCPKPTIAAVQGACVAAGFMVASVCDLIVASEDAFFADPVVRTLGAAAVEVLIHPWVLGARRAKEILFTGDRFTASEALAWGLVNRVVPRAELEAATTTLAERIAESESFSLKLVKRSINRTLDIQGMRSALNAHLDTHQLSHLSEAFKKARETGLAQAIAKGKAS
ncbi:enoyl-CoA hydratase [Pseudoroseomonas ludipueritiae]|uniref:Enoyl-CoA hydratase n=1 Tax=Pseudoroseomonas ludipueritiae TaxID=198093 RepID=A0ABR7RBM8_9PROT|nr:enoyl-CoA hydratase [Pseudoroseomonas ludipueritiae]MBC9179123.1 enoyl-CoA hydratase [Pseudoroseomonas ludipueritiae]